MNRRQFLMGAAAVPIAAVGQQERFLIKTLGVPRGAAIAESSLASTWGAKYMAIMRNLPPGYALAA